MTCTLDSRRLDLNGVGLHYIAKRDSRGDPADVSPVDTCPTTLKKTWRGAQPFKLG